MSQDTSPDTPGIGPALWAGILLCLAIGAGIFFFFTSSTPDDDGPVSEADFRFKPLEADDDLLESERTRLRGIETFDTEAVKTLREKYRATNRAQFNPPEVAALQEMQKELAFLAEEALLDTDVEGFIAAGRPIFEACEEGLTLLLSDLESGKLTLQDAQRDPPAAIYGTYRSNCGNVFPFLRQTDLVDEKGQWTNPKSGPEVFGVLSRYRWAHLIDLRIKPMKQLTPAERELMLRWRIEDPDAYPAQKREKFLVDAERELANYSAPLAAGRLAVEAGDWAKALEHWEKACAASPKDERLQSQCAWLRKKVSGGAAAPAAGSAPKAEAK